MTKLPTEIKDYNLTKVARFLMPAIGISSSFLERFRVKNAYLSKIELDLKYIHVEFEYNEEEFDITVYNALLDFYLFKRYYLKDDRLFFVFGINPNWNEVFELFLEGKYYDMGKIEYYDLHQIDNLIPDSKLYSNPKKGSTYLENYFYKHVPVRIDGKQVWVLSNNYKIMTRDDVFKKRVEDYLDTSIPEGADVFSKPNEEDFID